MLCLMISCSLSTALEDQLRSKSHTEASHAVEELFSRVSTATLAAATEVLKPTPTPPDIQARMAALERAAGSLCHGCNTAVIRRQGDNRQHHEGRPLMYAPG